MAERNFAFTPSSVAIGTVEAIGLQIYGSVDADVSLSALPTAPAVGARVVHIRGTLTVTAGGGAGSITIRCRQGQGVGGATVSLPANGFVTGTVPSQGTTIAFEFVDTAPALPALNYTITTQIATTGTSGVIMVEIEEVT